VCVCVCACVRVCASCFWKTSVTHAYSGRGFGGRRQAAACCSDARPTDARAAKKKIFITNLKIVAIRGTKKQKSKSARPALPVRTELERFGHGHLAAQQAHALRVGLHAVEPRAVQRAEALQLVQRAGLELLIFTVCNSGICIQYIRVIRAFAFICMRG
jgi:hypothetical protein